MANLVSFTVRGTDDTAGLWDKIREQAAASGAEAGTAFSEAFKRTANASTSVHGSSSTSNSVTDTIHEKLDTSSWKDAFGALEDEATKEAEKDAESYSSSFSKRLKSHTDDTFKGLVGDASGDISHDAENLGDDIARDVGRGIEGNGSSSGGIASSLSEALSAAPEILVPAAIGLGAAISPFIGQALAGGIVTAFGAGIAGMAILGAMMNAKVQKSFDSLKTSATGDLKTIGTSFVPVMQNIFSTAQSVLGKLTPVFAAAAKSISGPFQGFATTLEKSFAQPAVQKSISDIAGSFGQLLKAVTPQLATDVGAVAGAISNVALAVAKNPQGLADFITGLTKVTVFVLDTVAKLTILANYLDGQWKGTWQKMGGFITGVWAVITSTVSSAVDTVTAIVRAFAALLTGNWTALGNALTSLWNAVWHGITGSFAPILNGIVDVAKAIWPHIVTIGADVMNDLEATVHKGWSVVANYFSSMAAEVVNITHSWWSQVSSAVHSGWSTVINFISGMPGKITGEFNSLPGQMGHIGSDIMGDLWGGIKAGASPIVGWLGSFAKSVVNVFKTIWGWFSPSRVMYEGGKSLMDGLALGVKDHANKAQSQVQSVAGKVTAGVTQWTALVRQALQMEGLPLSLTGNVLYQMQTESGGNAAAINLTDSNALLGDPSKGLMQVIGTTFQEYHWPGTSNNIYDPLANIAAALNYAKSAYGPTLMSGGMGIGSGHGYAAGGATSSGWAMLGEMGREMVKLPGGAHVYPHGATEQMLAGGTQHQVQISFDAGGMGSDKKFMSAFLEYLRVNGTAKKVLNL